MRHLEGNDGLFKPFKVPGLFGAAIEDWVNINPRACNTHPRATDFPEAFATAHGHWLQGQYHIIIAVITTWH